MTTGPKGVRRPRDANQLGKSPADAVSPARLRLARNARRQAIIDGLLAKANKAAQKARRGLTALIAIFL